MIAAYTKEIEQLDQLLAGHKWFNGNQEASIADIQLGAELEFAGLFNYDFSNHKNVSNFLTNVTNNDHVLYLIYFLVKSTSTLERNPRSFTRSYQTHQIHFNFLKIKNIFKINFIFPAKKNNSKHISLFTKSMDLHSPNYFETESPHATSPTHASYPPFHSLSLPTLAPTV